MRIFLTIVALLAGCVDEAGRPLEDGGAGGEGDPTGADPTDPATPGTDPTTSGTTPTEGAPTIDFDPVDLVFLTDQTYDLDLSTGNVVAPAGVGPLLQASLTTDLLLGVVDVTGTDLQLRGAVADEDGNQDACAETVEFPVADFSTNPTFHVGPQPFVVTVSGVAISIEDLTLSGRFAFNGDAIEDITVEGVLDTAPLNSLLGLEVCDLLASFGVACAPCPSGGDTCVDVRIEDLSADLVPGLVLQEVTSGC